MVGYFEYSVCFSLDVQFVGLDVHFDVQAGKQTSKLGLRISGNIKDIKSIRDFLDIWNYARYDGILNIWEYRGYWE